MKKEKALNVHNKQYKQRCWRCGKYGHKPGDWIFKKFSVRILGNLEVRTINYQFLKTRLDEVDFEIVSFIFIISIVSYLFNYIS